MMKRVRFRAAAPAGLMIAALGAAGVAGPWFSTASAATASAVIATTNLSPEAIVSSRSTDRVKTLSTTLVLDDNATNRDELKKIGGAFATTYSFHEMHVTYAYPNKARFEGHSSIGDAYMVYNADQKLFKVPIPFFGKKIMNVHGQPGQKQSLLDLGIFARDWLTTDWEPHLIGHEGGLDIYKLTQRDSNNGSHDVVYVNPKTFVISRRLSYNGDNKLQKEMRFKNPVEVTHGIWVPTRIEIYNQFGKLGAAQDLRDTRVNGTVNEDLFQIQ